MFNLFVCYGNQAMTKFATGCHVHVMCMGNLEVIGYFFKVPDKQYCIMHSALAGRSNAYIPVCCIIGVKVDKYILQDSLSFSFCFLTSKEVSNYIILVPVSNFGLYRYLILGIG